MTHAVKRQPGEYGRKAPKNHPAIALSAILKPEAADIVIPSSENYGELFTALSMLGNDVAGDCVSVTWANFRALISTVLSGKTDYPSQGMVWEIYKTQNPNFNPDCTEATNGPGSDADQGMDIQTLLEYLVKTGGPDGVKLLAFAKVDFSNIAELEAALAIFGLVWYGVNVQAQNETAFSNGKTWTYVKSGQTVGGHSVPGVGFDGKIWNFYTWAQETAFDEKFRENLVEEAWVCIWPENVGSKQFMDGIDLAALASEYKSLTGNDFPVTPPAPVPPVVVPPVPTPTPEPTPTPDPDPTPDNVIIANQNLAAAIPVGWTMRRHEGDVKKVAHALATWANAVGENFTASAEDEDQR